MANYEIKLAQPAFEFDTDNYRFGKTFLIDSTHAYVGYKRGATVAGEVLAIDGSYNVTTSVDVFLIDTATGSTGTSHTCIQIDSNHFLHLFVDDSTTSSNTAQVVEVNTTTYAISTVGTAYIWTGSFSQSTVCMIDSNHFLGIWSGTDSDGFSQVFGVDTTTWNVSTGAVFEFDTTNGTFPSVKPIDANHFLVSYYAGATNIGYARTLAVDTSTWAVTTIGSGVKFDTQSYYGGDLVKIDDTTFVCVWSGYDGYLVYAQALVVSTSTWNVTTGTVSQMFVRERIYYQDILPTICAIDTTNFLVAYGTVSGSEVLALTIDTGTYEIYTSAYAYPFGASTGYPLGHDITKIDATHFLCLYQGSDSDGFAQVLEIETKAQLYDLTAPYFLESKDGYDVVFTGVQGTGYQPTVQRIDTTHAVVFYVTSSPSGLGGDYSLIAQPIVIDTDANTITTTGTSLTFLSTQNSAQVYKTILMDENHVAVAWRDTDLDGWVQIFEINTSTWAVSTSNSALEFDVTRADGTVGGKIDDTHFVLMWNRGSGIGYTQVFSVNTSTWEITTAAASLYIGDVYANQSMVMADANHFIASWKGKDGDGFVQVFEINTSTWEVARMDTQKEFNIYFADYNSIVKMDDTTFFNVYQQDYETFGGQQFTVNTSTWVVTTSTTRSMGSYANHFNRSSWNNSINIDSTHLLNARKLKDGSGAIEIIQAGSGISANLCHPPMKLSLGSCSFPTVFAIDSEYVFAGWNGTNYQYCANIIKTNYKTPLTITTASGFSITTASSAVSLGTGRTNTDICMIDENHGIAMGTGTSEDGFINVFTVNTTTLAITTSSALEFDTVNGMGCKILKIDSNHALGFWGGTSGYYPLVSVFTINTSTWAITRGTNLQYGTLSSSYNHLAFQIDTNHFVSFNAFASSGGRTVGFLQVFTVNTSTWAVTTSSPPLSFEQEKYRPDHMATAIQIDSNHFFVVYSKRVSVENDMMAGTFYGRMFEVDTTTWMPKALPQVIILAADGMTGITGVALSSSRFAIIYSDKTSARGYTQGYVVNTSNWEVSTCGDKYMTGDAQLYNNVIMMDSTHFVDFYTTTGYYPRAQSFSVSTDGKIVKKLSDTLIVDTTASTFTIRGITKYDTSHFIGVSYISGGTGATLQVFAVDVTPPRLPDYQITTAASLTFDTGTNQYNSCVAIDSTHYVNFWAGTDSDGLVQAFAVNTSTWAVTTAGASLEFDTGNGTHNKCCLVDANHVINFWANPTKGGVQMFAVDTSTWAVTTAGALFEFVADTGVVAFNSCFLVDSNHVINFWQENSATGYAQIFAVDTSTWAVSTAGAALAYEAAGAEPMYNACYSIDATHYINFWRDTNNDGFTQVFIVNTSTWAISTATGVKKWEDTKATYTTVCAIDSNHYLVFWAGADDDGMAQVIAVDTSTWAVTTASAVFEFDTANGMHNSCVQINSTRYVNFWSGNGDDGYVQVFDVSTSSWEITTASPLLEFEPTLNGFNSCAAIDTQHIINFFAGTDNKGYSQVFSLNDLYYCNPNIESVGVQQIISKGSNRTYEETLTATTSLTTLQGKNFNEGVFTASVLSKVATALREFVESVGVVVDFVKTMPKTFVETVSVVSSYLGNLSKIFIENVGVIVSYLKVIPKEFTEAVNVVESFLKSVLLDFWEYVIVVEGWLKEMGKIFVENVGVVVENTWASIREFTESVGIHEVFSKIVLILKVFSENVRLLGETFQKTMSILRTESVVMVVDNLRLILNGFLVGSWKKITFVIGGIWTKK